jgi:hypothetical protein
MRSIKGIPKVIKLSTRHSILILILLIYRDQQCPTSTTITRMKTQRKKLSTVDELRLRDLQV